MKSTYVLKSVRNDILIPINRLNIANMLLEESCRFFDERVYTIKNSEKRR